MQFLIVTLICIVSFSNGFINIYPKLHTYELKAKSEDVGDPLILTPLIEAGKIDEARTVATVEHKVMMEVSSYAGYFTVNKEYNSNMFFWFFPAQVKFLILFDFY